MIFVEIFALEMRDIMKAQKDVFMTLLTAFGGILGLILYFVSTMFLKKYQTIAGLSIFGLAMIFRVVGYLIDKKLAKKG